MFRNVTTLNPCPQPEISDKATNAPLLNSVNLFGLPNSANPSVEVQADGTKGDLQMSFIDFKCPDFLADYFGYDKNDIYLGALSLAFEFAFPIFDASSHPAFESYQIFGGTVTNNLTPLPPGAPIPGSLLLLGSGIITMLGIGLRKKA